MVSLLTKLDGPLYKLGKNMSLTRNHCKFVKSIINGHSSPAKCHNPRANKKNATAVAFLARNLFQILLRVLRQGKSLLVRLL